jgi:GT2 family glycosyltransferase
MEPLTEPRSAWRATIAAVTAARMLASLSVSAIVVSFESPDAARGAVESLLAQSAPPREVLLVDNHPAGLTGAAMESWGFDERVRLVHSGANIGYAAACNRAAAHAHGDWLFFLNPDARADPQCLKALLRQVGDHTGVIGAQVLLPDGRVNAGDNPVHLTGIAWAGRFGKPREDGPPRPVASVSGAALLASARAFRQVGGLCERFFLYMDDVDLCWRMQLAGWRVIFAPQAVVWHDYEFDKGLQKWYWLERNRLWAVLSNYSASTLLLLAPMLLASELVVIYTALRDGWLRGLLRAWGSLLASVPELRSWRRRVQDTRCAHDSDLIELMAAHFETELLENSLALRAAPLMSGYRRALIKLLRLAGR